MADLTRIDPAQLNSALTERGASLQRSLSKEDSLTLIGLMEALARRYPSQDHESSIREYHRDYERLAKKHGIAHVAEAIMSLRIDPDQGFFPRPDEVAAKIEIQCELGKYEADRREGIQRRADLSKAAQEHYKFMREWEASGLSLAEFCSKEKP